jgi:hypothetical protein
MKCPCDNCLEYQESLNPGGCFRGYGSTGLFGKTWKKLFGCEYQRKSKENKK